MRAGWEAGRGGASPLREVVASLQAELAEREAALVQAQEDLARERTKGADLQRQLLQQVCVREEGLGVEMATRAGGQEGADLQRRPLQ